jgi:hypothetical protein
MPVHCNGLIFMNTLGMKNFLQRKNNKGTEISIRERIVQGCDGQENIPFLDMFVLFILCVIMTLCIITHLSLCMFFYLK